MLHQMPTITAITPDIMFRSFSANHLQCPSFQASGQPLDEVSSLEKKFMSPNWRGDREPCGKTVPGIGK